MSAPQSPANAGEVERVVNAWRGVMMTFGYAFGDIQKGYDPAVFEMREAIRALSTPPAQSGDEGGLLPMSSLVAEDWSREAEALTTDTSKEGADVREAVESIIHRRFPNADAQTVMTVAREVDVALRASQPPEQAGMVLEAQRQTIETCARVAEAYLARMSAIVTLTEGDDDNAAAACWHARQIANSIRALRPNASLSTRPRSTRT